MLSSNLAMRRILSGICLGFTIAGFSFFEASAGPFVHAPIRGEGYANKPAAPPAPDPKKLALAEPMLDAVRHCSALADIINKPVDLIDAFNYQPDLDNLPKGMSRAEKEKAMIYMMGRPDIPDFGFLIPNIWRTATRIQRLKFNSLATLKLAEALGFKPQGLPFHDNCKASASDITSDKTGVQHVVISMPLAFDVKEVKLDYLLSRQPNYNWQVDDLLINNVGAANYIKKDLAQSIVAKGLSVTIGNICQTSGFKTLKCD